MNTLRIAPLFTYRADRRGPLPKQRPEAFTRRDVPPSHASSCSTEVGHLIEAIERWHASEPMPHADAGLETLAFVDPLGCIGIVDS